MKYVAFLRGINVGGRSIKMIELKSCFEAMRLLDVRTVLKTGNVIFESDQVPTPLKKNIEAALTKTFNYPAKVQVYDTETLRKIVAANPFSDQSEDFHQYVLFFEDGLEKHLYGEANQLDKAIEAILLGDGVIYWSVLKGSTLSSKFSKYLTKAAYNNYHTNRNITTLKKVIG